MEPTDTTPTLDAALSALRDRDETGPFPCRGEFVMPVELEHAVTAYMDAIGVGRNQRSRMIRRLLRAGVLAEGRKILKAAPTA